MKNENYEPRKKKRIPHKNIHKNIKTPYTHKTKYNSNETIQFTQDNSTNANNEILIHRKKEKLLSSFLWISRDKPNNIHKFINYSLYYMIFNQFSYSHSYSYSNRILFRFFFGNNVYYGRVAIYLIVLHSIGLYWRFFCSRTILDRSSRIV